MTKQQKDEGEMKEKSESEKMQEQLEPIPYYPNSLDKTKERC